MKVNVEVADLLHDVVKRLGDLEQPPPPKMSEWLTLEEAHALKGGCSCKTMKSRHRLQPRGGVEDAKVGGRRVWHRETVLEWLAVTDDKLEAYLESCATRHRMTPIG